MRATLDHLVFATSSLENGTQWLEEKLGAPLSPGGRHETMGTHNRLLRLGGNSYLELIAIDPAARKPDRPRWFELDARHSNGSLDTPSLIGWAAARRDLNSGGFSPGYDVGRVTEMSRGSLSWLITIRDDGALPEGGVLPSLIEWPEGVHPAPALPELGVTLTQLELRAPDPNHIERALASIGIDTAAESVRVIQDSKGPALRAHFETPQGPLAL